MRKIPTVLVRDPDDRRHVLPEITPGCEWVLAGEGTPRRKYDGTCVMLDDAGQWWARREVKPGKMPPRDWVLADHDEVTGKSVGWEPIEQSSFTNFHAEALTYQADRYGRPFTPGTYELIGPKINGNPDKATSHLLVPHDLAETPDQLFDASVGDHSRPWFLVSFVGRKYGWEGVVWHHPDGRMAKLKHRDLPLDPTRA